MPARWQRWRARRPARGEAPEAGRAALSGQAGDEFYAEILLGTGDAAAAVVQFKASLARTPRRAQSLLGLARAASAAGQPTLAAETARDFLKAWRLADKDRPELAEARALAR